MISVLLVIAEAWDVLPEPNQGDGSVFLAGMSGRVYRLNDMDDAWFSREEEHKEWYGMWASGGGGSGGGCWRLWLSCWRWRPRWPLW